MLNFVLIASNINTDIVEKHLKLKLLLIFNYSHVKDLLHITWLL